VTALLDAEQYDAVTTDPQRPLLVLGSAGSGKTTVALHRLSKIAFDHPQRYPQKRLKVIVPEEGLSRLTRRLLSPLGLDRVPVETLWSWAYSSACEAFGVRAIKVWSDTPPAVARLKRHPVLRRALAARLGAGRLVAASLPKLRAWLGDAFADRDFLQAVVKAASGELSLTAIDECVRHTKLQLATPLSKELEGIDPEKLKTVDGMSIEEGTPDELAGTVDLEDLPILLFLKAQQGDPGLQPLAHVVLDEAEDFSLFELSVVGSLLGAARSCTLAGDEVQQTTSGFAGWSSAMNELGIRDAAVCRLQVSYRCPWPVVSFARKVLGNPASESTGRLGPPVGHHHFPDEAQASLFVGEALRDLMSREPNASVAVIAHSPDSARKVYRVIQDMPWARLVQEGEFSFEPGVDVTDVDNVKGLEFDYVVIPDATAVAYPVDDEARRRLHVASTRASHQLWVVSSGVRSRIAPMDGA
jgi:DNA helicase IV